MQKISSLIESTNPNSLIRSSLRIDMTKSRSSIDGVDDGVFSFVVLEFSMRMKLTGKSIDDE